MSLTWSEFLIKNQDKIIDSIVTHIYLVFISVAIASIIAIPVGIYLGKHKKVAKPILSVLSIIQTIPGLVMLGFAMLLFGLGLKPAIFALALYAVFPIVTNTYEGIENINAGLKEAAKGIGMNSMQVLFKVELPIALSSILGGIRISTVYIVSWATLAALISAGGLGDLIWTGLATYEYKYIISGALPAAVMAIGLGYILDFVQKAVTPRGLKLKG